MYSTISFWSCFDVDRPTVAEDNVRKRIFTLSFRVTLTFKFAPLVTIIERYVSSKLEVPTAFQFREKIGNTGRTDGRSATLNAPS